MVYENKIYWVVSRYKYIVLFILCLPILVVVSKKSFLIKNNYSYDDQWFAFNAINAILLFFLPVIPSFFLN